MIELKSISSEKPYMRFKALFEKAINAGQNSIEAACISSLSEANEINSRFVNVKSITGTDFIFFSNYRSPKALEFKNHNQISVVFFWNKIKLQIRLKAVIEKTDKRFNNEYFINRYKRKNALAISSDQSKKINSYQEVEKNFLRSMQDDDLTQCPDYWGGFTFRPYYFEFWEGHESFLNNRDVYQSKYNSWEHIIIQP